MKSVCLAILNFNGRKHLEHLLPTALTAAKNSPIATWVLVLDNCSTEGDLDWVHGAFPEVKTMTAPKNDYLFSYNWLFPQLKDDIVVILNNDLRLDGHFLEPLLRHFDRSDVFAVSASSYDWEGRQRTSGQSRLKYNHGFFRWYFECKRQDLCHTLFASGGFMAVDRSKYVEINGFSRLFFPAYCEDVDLCFRAWRRGWRTIYEPESIVWHREHASWEVSPLAKANVLYLRHSLFFQWSSLPMKRGRLKRYWSLAKIFIGELLVGKTEVLKIYSKAWLDWIRMRKGFKSMRVSELELQRIQMQIEEKVNSISREKV